MKVFGAKERFGSLTFAKRWLVCWAKGNVPNVGRLSAFLSCGSAKKLNLFSGDGRPDDPARRLCLPKRARPEEAQGASQG